MHRVAACQAAGLQRQASPARQSLWLDPAGSAHAAAAIPDTGAAAVDGWGGWARHRSAGDWQGCAAAGPGPQDLGSRCGGIIPLVLTKTKSMPAVKAAAKAEYFEAARSWESDRIRSAIQSRRTAWIVAGCACALAVVAVGAVAMLAPLKQAVPYVIRVDRSTGETEILTALKGPSPRTYDDAVNRYFLSQYVRLREGWLPQAARENAYSVVLMSAAQEQGRYLAGVVSSNKDAPSNLYGDKGYVSITIRSISYLSPTVAQVRFTRIVTMAPNAPVAQNWNALITFDFTAAPELEKDRNINPLGFQVLNYRADPEA
jgi:type IV secretion system protein VirB8